MRRVSEFLVLSAGDDGLGHTAGADSAGREVNRMKKLGAIAALGAALVALHGITSEKWEDWHTAFTALGGAVALVTLVEK
jgi:hypothetical protein